ncbi:MAG: aminotransferase class V-fold PLP-dependent enzyme [Mariprofundaceae bacterium]
MLSEFPLHHDLVYLNHAAVGVWPKRTADAVREFADENMRQGATDYPKWMKVERELRGRLSRLVGAASSDDIALVKNTSEGLSLIAYGLDWQAGDNVVSSDLEFPSNRMVWQSLASQGVEFREADISSGDPEEALMALCDDKTRLMTISSVQFGTGLRMDIKRLGEFCRDRGILFCVDAIQSLGAVQFDALDCKADFVVADAHKWMLGPEGVAVFYSTQEARDRLKLTQFGWHMAERLGDFDVVDWQVAQSARRFEPGSPNTLGIHALNASLSLLEEIGMDQVEALLLERVELLMLQIQQQSKLELLSSSETQRFAGIVTFKHRDLDEKGHAALYRHLMMNRVICAARGGGIRFAPHFYTDMSCFDRAWGTINKFL